MMNVTHRPVVRSAMAFQGTAPKKDTIQPKAANPLTQTLLMGLTALGGGALVPATTMLMTQAPTVVRAEEKKAVTTKVIEVTDANFEKEVLQSDVPVLIKFGAPWCPPCRRMDPELDKLSIEAKYDKKLTVARINIDDNPKMAKRFGVTSIPDTILFKKDKKEDKEATQKERISGFMDKAGLEKIVDKHIEQDPPKEGESK